MERVKKKMRNPLMIESKELTNQEEWNNIVTELFHQIRSSLVSIGGYTRILSDQYSIKMDLQLKHYMRRIIKNLEKADHGVRVLKECLDNKKNRGGKL